MIGVGVTVSVGRGLAGGGSVISHLWTPASITTAAWYDAADATTITSSLGAVSQWDDKSGNGHHVTQATGAAQPLTGSSTMNGRNVLSFDGTDDYLSKASADVLSVTSGAVFVVAKRTGTGDTTQGLVTKGTGGATVRLDINLKDGTNPIFWTSDGTTAYPRSATEVTVGSTAILAGFWAYDTVNTTVAIYKDGTSTAGNLSFAGPVPTASSDLVIGWMDLSRFLFGDVAEVIIFNNELTINDRQTVEGYLAHKWGLTANLPSGHPYKSNPPISAPLWTPHYVSPTAWYDASDTNTITESGGSVSQWDDKSGSGYHATQATGANQPVYTSGQYLTFDGSDDGLDVTGLLMEAEQISLFAVFNSDDITPTGLQMIFDCSGSTQGTGLYIDESFDKVLYTSRFNGTLVSFGHSITISSGVDVLSSVVFTTGENSCFLDGTLDSNVTTTWTGVGTQNLPKTTIGYDATVGGRLFDGKIKEIIYFETALTTLDRQKVEGYLAHKWGLTANLPSGHPYKVNAPTAEPLWTPANITTTAWYDAADAATITESGGSVSQWSDKSGNGYHATQATGANQPATGSRTIDGRNTLSFDGSTSFLALSSVFQPAGDDYMIFAVIDSDAVSTPDARIFNGEVSGNTRFALFYRIAGGDGITFIQHSSFTPVVYGTYAAGKQIVAGYRNSTTGAAGQDGDYTTAATVGTVATITDMYIGCVQGANNFFDGAIGELVIIQGYSIDDRQKMEGYLAHKWGLTANLPSGHPYKISPP